MTAEEREMEERLGMLPTEVRRGDLFISAWLGRFLLAASDPLPGTTLYGTATVRILWLVSDPLTPPILRAVDYEAGRRLIAVSLLLRRR